MKLRNIVVAGLMIALATAVMALIVKETRAKSSDAPVGPPPGAVASDASKVIAYYFHRTVRCDACRAIEGLARVVIEAEFAEELRAGWLEWHAINVEEAGNEAFVQEYDLTMPALVLVKITDGRPARWTKLQRVWELVENPPAYTQYVRDELHGCLQGS